MFINQQWATSTSIKFWENPPEEPNEFLMIPSVRGRDSRKL